MNPQGMQTGVAESGAFVSTMTIEPKGLGILDGVRFAVKDLIDLEGHKTGCGNPTWRDTHPAAAANAVCVDQLLYSGGRCVGKSVLDELAFGLNGENFFHGTPLNPNAPERVPGGSSSGSASAVACGIVDCALGTDTGGSVRVPAGNCGIFGMRPSHGAVSLAGVNPLAPSFDTVGGFASTCGLLSRMMSVLLAREIDSTPEVETVHFLVDAFAQSDSEVRNALQGPVELVKKTFPGKCRDTTLASVTGPDRPTGLHSWYETYCHVQWAEIWSCLGPWVTENAPEFGPRTRMNFELVERMDRRKTVEAIHRRERYSHALRTFLRERDLVCMPTTPTIAPLKGSLGIDRTMGDYYPRTLAFTALAGIGRLPQTTLPMARVHGVPIGLSLLAARGEDAFLLAAARMVADMGNLNGARQ